MKFFTVAILALCATAAYATTVGEHTEGTGFCYREKDGCGPSSKEWSPLCQKGKRQSPINIPLKLVPTGMTALRLFDGYKGKSFRMQNNGHAVQVDFVGPSGKNEGPTSKMFFFPDPLAVNRIGYANQQVRNYTFASAHFHWGVNDFATGSEHCIAGRCAAMELHLVHYLSKYKSMADAVASGDENALAVLGVLIDVNPLKFISHLSMAPIVKNMKKIEVANHDKFVTVNQPLDFSLLLLANEPPMMYSYKGSLTTPGCNEQVNWYVLSKPVHIAHKDLQAFRTIIKDMRRETLTENHRPLQALNNRLVLKSKIIPAF